MTTLGLDTLQANQQPTCRPPIFYNYRIIYSKFSVKHFGKLTSCLIHELMVYGHFGRQKHFGSTHFGTMCLFPKCLKFSIGVTNAKVSWTVWHNSCFEYCYCVKKYRPTIFATLMEWKCMLGKRLIKALSELAAWLSGFWLANFPWSTPDLWLTW